MTTVEEEHGIVDDDDYRVSLSLPTEDDRTAWLEPGLRIELAIASGALLGRGPSPRLGLTSFLLRPRLRLDRYWSLAATFGYAVANGDYTGMRWSGLIEPVFHPLPALGISFGLGVGGLGVSNPSVGLPSLGQQEISTRTLGDDERVMDCAGEGWASVARLEYLFVVGPLFSTGPYAVADAQWTRCEETLGGVDRETGKATLGRQWWLNAGGSIGWWFSWR